MIWTEGRSVENGEVHERRPSTTVKGRRKLQTGEKYMKEYKRKRGLNSTIYNIFREP